MQTELERKSKMLQPFAAVAVVVAAAAAAAASKRVRLIIPISGFDKCSLPGDCRQLIANPKA